MEQRPFWICGVSKESPRSAHPFPCDVYNMLPHIVIWCNKILCSRRKNINLHPNQIINNIYFILQIYSKRNGSQCIMDNGEISLRQCDMKIRALFASLSGEYPGAKSSSYAHLFDLWGRGRWSRVTGEANELWCMCMCKWIREKYAKKNPQTNSSAHCKSPFPILFIFTELNLEFIYISLCISYIF